MTESVEWCDECRDVGCDCAERAEDEPRDDAQPEEES